MVGAARSATSSSSQRNELEVQFLRYWEHYSVLLRFEHIMFVMTVRDQSSLFLSMLSAKVIRDGVVIEK